MRRDFQSRREHCTGEPRGGAVKGGRSVAPDGSLLCVGCGMCCDGTLYSRVKITADELSVLSDDGFSFFSLDEEEFFRQPCPKVSCGSCTIYRTRPRTCRTYRCALLK